MATKGFVNNVRKGFKSLFSSSSNRVREDKNILCADLPFDCSEAYKLLRANLSFSIPEGNGCRIIGITSSIRGEGKSTVAINLSYTIAMTGRKVLLVDSDMRLPSVAKKLKMISRPGLSNVIVDLCTLREAIRPSGILDSWDVIPAGSIPPNPSELLGTESTRGIFEDLRKMYDTIIVDLPPIDIVSDAMVLSNIIDGYIIVARQDYTDKGSFEECMRIIKVIENKILGVVLTSSTKSEKGYYSRSGHRYGYANGYRKKYGYDRSERYGYATRTSRDQEFVDAAKETVNSQ